MTDILSDAPTDNGGQADVATATQTKTWYDGADPDTVGYIQNKKWDAESPLKIVESYRNLEKFHGVPADQIIKLPKSGEPMDAVYNRLGRPESADKYAPVEGIEFNADIMKRFDSKFHAAGLNNEQRSAILAEYGNFEKEIQAQNATAIEQEKAIQIDALKKEWGAHYDERLVLAKQAARAMLPDSAQRDEVFQAMESAIGPAVLAKMFANLADKLGEDKIHSGADGGNRQFGYTKEQALNDKNTLINEIKTDPQRLAMYNKGMGNDVEKLLKLNKILSGE